MLQARSMLLAAVLAASLAPIPVQAAAQDVAITHVTAVDVAEALPPRPRGEAPVRA